MSRRSRKKYRRSGDSSRLAPAATADPDGWLTKEVEGRVHLVPELEEEQHEWRDDCRCRPIPATMHHGRERVLVHGLR